MLSSEKPPEPPPEPQKPEQLPEPQKPEQLPEPQKSEPPPKPQNEASALVAGREHLKTAKEILEVTGLLVLAAIAVFTFSRQIEYMVATFMITALSICAFVWLYRQIRRRPESGGRLALWVFGAFSVVAFTCSAVKLYYWKSITYPAVLSEEQSFVNVGFTAEGQTILATAEWRDGDAKQEYRGNWVKVILTKKVWAESLRVASVRVFVDEKHDVPKSAIEVQEQTMHRIQPPVLYTAKLPRPGESVAASLKGILGVVPLEKDNPFLMIMVECMTDAKVIATVRIEVEVTDNDALGTYKLISKPIKIVCTGSPPAQIDPKNEMMPPVAPPKGM
jgi:hypothetical protein